MRWPGPAGEWARVDYDPIHNVADDTLQSSNAGLRRVIEEGVEDCAACSGHCALLLREALHPEAENNEQSEDLEAELSGSECLPEMPSTPGPQPCTDGAVTPSPCRQGEGGAAESVSSAAETNKKRRRLDGNQGRVDKKPSPKRDNVVGAVTRTQSTIRAFLVASPKK